MTDRNANRPGYKKTKVGWIPNEWEEKRFKEIVKRRSERFDPRDPENPDIKCIELSNIEQETGSINGYIWAKEQRSSKNKFFMKDVLFGKLRPYLRKFYFADFQGVCSSEIWVFVANKGIIPKFLFYLIQTNKFIYLANVTTGTKMPRADWDFLKDRYFGIPPINKQKKIAEILSTWDRAIEQTQKLIDAKRRLKRGLMQQLLTGRMRFPGFGAPVEKAGELPEGWEKHRMSNVINILGGGTPARKEENYWHGEIPWLAVGDFSDTTRYVYESEEKITKAGLENSNTKLLEKGAVIISARGTVGAIAQLAKPMAFNQTSYGLIGKEKCISNDYLFYFLKNNIQLFVGVKYGAVFDTITKDTFKYIFLDLPRLSEQIEIIKILSTIDKEIDLLTDKIKLINEQKQGLMQRLLLGEIRAIEGRNDV